MKLSRSKLLKGCINPYEIDKLLIQAEKVLKTWVPHWTTFITAPIREEICKIYDEIAELTYLTNGGYPNAERQRVLIYRSQQKHKVNINQASCPIRPLQIEGNFLFDRTTTNDFRNALTQAGLKLEDIGDIWITGDRGAQAICTLEGSQSLHNQKSNIRDVEIQFKAIAIEDLRLNKQRIPKTITTIEASKRLDAIASAGFGLSRSRISSQLNEGRLRLNWQETTNASKKLVIGDQIQLEGKGSIEVKNIEPTKRKRWRVELLRQ